jgi:hypothetical protein
VESRPGGVTGIPRDTGFNGLKSADRTGKVLAEKLVFEVGQSGQLPLDLRTVSASNRTIPELLQVQLASVQANLMQGHSDLCKYGGWLGPSGAASYMWV